MESIRHKAILKSWIETGMLAILTKHVGQRDVQARTTRAIVEVDEFLNYLKWNQVRDVGKRDVGTGRMELMVAPDRTCEQWHWAFDLTCDEPYFGEVDYQYGWRFHIDPESGELMIERFDKTTEAQG